MILKKSLIVFCSAGALSLFAVSGCSSSTSTTDGGGGNDGGGGGDGSALDSGKDTGPKPDTGPGPAMCPEPADVSSFAPGVPTPPRAKDATACVLADYTDFYNACYGANATTMTCQTWTMGHQKCSDCINSNDSDAQWGLLVNGGGVSTLNVAGCLELVGEHTCAVAYSQVGQCTELGCKTQCPVTDQASFTLYQSCVTKVSSLGCKKYVDARNTACVADGSVGKCTGAGFNAAGMAKLGPAFCGP